MNFYHIKKSLALGLHFTLIPNAAIAAKIFDFVLQAAPKNSTDTVSDKSIYGTIGSALTMVTLGCAAISCMLVMCRKSRRTYTEKIDIIMPEHLDIVIQEPHKDVQHVLRLV